MTMTEPPGRYGTLFYIIGASGAGKDSLMRYARTRLAGKPVAFAHRYITRPVELEGENHIALHPVEFARRLQHGCFAMHWHSHGLDYGIGQEIRQWLGGGLNVVVNGSRAYLPQAQHLFPLLTPVLVRTAPDKLAERLHARGRETAEDIRQRLHRAAALAVPDCPRLQVVNNDGAVEAGGEALCAVVQA